MEPKEGRDKLGWCWWLLVSVIVALVVTAAFITLWRDFHYFHSNNSHAHRVMVDKYADALSIAMQFFDIQKCIQSLSKLELHFLC